MRLLGDRVVLEWISRWPGGGRRRRESMFSVSFSVGLKRTWRYRSGSEDGNRKTVKEDSAGARPTI